MAILRIFEESNPNIAILDYNGIQKTNFMLFRIKETRIKKEHNWNVHKVDLDNNKVSDEIELQGPDICAAFWQFWR